MGRFYVLFEALATKIEWHDAHAPAWDGLVAAFRAGRDLDLSRLREFGATLEEVATLDRGAPGRDHALKIARAAVMVANAAAVAQGDEVPVPSSDPLTWGGLCGMVVRGEPRVAYLARSFRCRSFGAAPISASRSMIDRISCRSLRGWKNWKKMSLSAGSRTAGRRPRSRPRANDCPRRLPT